MIPIGPTGRDKLAQVEGSLWRPQAWEKVMFRIRADYPMRQHHENEAEPISESRSTAEDKARDNRCLALTGLGPDRVGTQGVARSSLCPGLPCPGPLGLKASKTCG